MLTLWSGNSKPFCDGISRRDFLRAGGLGIGGLTLADLLRLQAEAAPAVPRKAGGKSVIMVVLPGGPSHIDMYDLKPEAPAEIRGEFQPISTNVPGTMIGELLPRQARIADKMTIVRSFQVAKDLQHALHEVYTGFPGEANQEFPGGGAVRPAFGSVVSHFRGNASPLPAYVSLRHNYISRAVPVAEDPAYLGAAHGPFVPSGPGMQNLALPKGISGERLGDRKRLLAAFDSLRRNIDAEGDGAATDSFTARALNLVTSAKVRDAFDVSREPAHVREAYGPAGTLQGASSGKLAIWNPLPLLQARRLVEAGVSVVTVALGGWDHHSAAGEPKIFDALRSVGPVYDQAIAALIDDIYQRGLDKDVLVVVWGEFGRTPRISDRGGRDHWPPAGFVLFAGGGLKMGQVIGATDRRGERPTSTPIGPQQVLATMYRHLGISPAATLPDLRGRPMYLLDDPRPIPELT